MHITICTVGLQWNGMEAAERNKLPTSSYFFPCLVFSPHDMNVFVTDLTADNLVTHMQGFSSGF